MNCTSVTPQSNVVCRLCTKSHAYYVNIFISNESCEIIVEESIQDVLGLPVAVGDGLPNHVCRLCVRKLIEFREFKNMCFKSATELRAYALGNDFLVSKIKDEDAADIETSREGSSHENTFLNGMQVSEVYVTMPDELAIRNVSHAKEELWSTDNALVVKEEVIGEEHHIEGNVPMNALTSFAVDPLAVDTMTLKEEAHEPKVAAGEGNSLGDTSPHNHIQVTEVFVPFPDELAMGIVRYAEEDSRPTELIVKEEIGAGLECSENNVPVGSLSSVNVDPLAVDTTVNRCKNIGGKTEEQENKSEIFGADRQGISQNKVLNSPFCDPVYEENLQLRFSMAKSFVVDCFPERRVTRQEKNVKIYASSKKFSQLNERQRPIRNHKREQLCHEAENTSYPNEYVCNYCSARYSERKSLALHIEKHLDGTRFARVFPKTDFPSTFSKNLLVKDRGKLERVMHERSSISFRQKSSRRKNEKPTVEECYRGDKLGKELYKSRKLLFHSVKPREKAEFVCDTCGMAFLKKGDLVKHVHVHTGLNPLHCRFCGGKLISKDMLKGHQAMHTVVEWLKCNLCGKECSACRDQQKLVVTHTNFKPLKCDLCGNNFKNTKNLKRHSLIHTGVKPIKCNECGKMFFTRSDLIRHSVVHTGVKPFKCNDCGKMFTRKSHLKSHSVVHTGVKPFKCNECGKMFTTSRNLIRHSVVHTGVKAFKCNECGKMFSTKSILKMHSVVHTGVKPFKCNECGKMFSTKSVLKMHLVVHTDVKKFKCNECGKMFSRSSGLYQHSFVHTGLKLFKCNECGKMFSHSGSLRNHSLVHTGVKPFKCDECGKMFPRRSYLKIHSRVHSGVNPFKCDFCGEQFKWKTALNRHLQTHADQNTPK